MCFCLPHPRARTRSFFFFFFFHAAPFPETRCDGLYVLLRGPEMTPEESGPSSSSPLSSMVGGTRADLSQVAGRGGCSWGRGLSFL